MTTSLGTRIHAVIRTVPDFPKPGIQFKDITPLLANAELMTEVVGAMCAPFTDMRVTHVVGIESRGFLFGVPAALRMQKSFVPVRKPGKLPAKTMRESYTLEYGSDSLEMHADAVDATSRVLIVDDILATGGTIAAACRLVERSGATVVGVSLLGEIAGLCAPEVLSGRAVSALVSF